MRLSKSISRSVLFLAIALVAACSNSGGGSNPEPGHILKHDSGSPVANGSLQGDVLSEYGVRRDVYEYLQREFRDAGRFQAAVLVAKHAQSVLATQDQNLPVNPEYLNKVKNAMKCLIVAFNGEFVKAYDATREIDARTYNTPARLRAFVVHGSKLSDVVDEAVHVSDPCEAAK